MDKSSIHSFVRGVGFGVIGSVLNKGLRYLFLLVAARILTVSSFGLLMFLVGLYNLVQRFLMLGINKSIDYYVPKYLSESNYNAARSALFTAFTLILIIGCTAAIFTAFLANAIAAFLDRPSTGQYILLLSVALPVYMYQATLRNAFLAVKQVRYRVLMADFGYQLGKIAFLVILVGFLGYGFMGAVGAFVLATFAAALGGTLLFITTNSWVRSVSITGFRLREIAKYSLPLSAAIATAAVIGQIDVILLGTLSTDRDVAIYKIAYSVAMLLGFLPPAFNAIFKPIIAENERNIDLITMIHHNTTRWIIILTAPLAATIISHPSDTIAVLFGESYVGDPLVLWTLVAGQISMLSFGLQQSLLQGLNTTRPIFSGKIIVLGVNVGIDIALIPIFGPLGAAIGTSAGLVLGAVYFALVLYRTKGVSPFSGPQLKVLTLLLPITIVGSQMTYPNPLLELGGTFLVTGILYLLLLLVVRGMSETDLIVINNIEEQLGVKVEPVKKVIKFGISKK